MTVQGINRTYRALVWMVASGMATAVGVALACSDARADDELGRELSGPAFSSEGDLLLPSNYREWVNLTSSLNLSYDSEVTDPNAPAPQVFQNVFASRMAYRRFLRSGTWPDKTMLLIEIRQALTNPTVREGALVQGELRAFVADVKDLSRYGGNGWRFFAFNDENGNIVDQAAPLDTSRSCYSCHGEHAAVDNTFVQFYPSLFEIAKEKGTISPDWDPDAKL